MSENNLNDDVLPEMPEDSELVVDSNLADEDVEAVTDLSEDNPVETEAVLEDVTPVMEELPVVVELDDNNVIASPEVVETPEKKQSSLGSVADNVVGSPAANKKDKPKPSTKKAVDTVAIFSTRNVTWSGVGKVYRGYNIVKPEEAEKWLTRDHTRLATPEEVAKEFNL